MVPTVRRVVTGETPSGKGVFTHVEDVDPLAMGAITWYPVWGWDAVPTVPFFDPAPYRPRSAFPPPRPNGAVRINAVVMEAGYGVAESVVAQPSPEYVCLVAAQPPGGQQNHAAGLHSTDTIDFAFVVSGEVCLVQDDGAEITMRPGDVCVQNGALHAWKNRSNDAALIYFVMFGTNRSEQ